MSNFDYPIMLLSKNVHDIVFERYTKAIIPSMEKDFASFG